MADDTNRRPFRPGEFVGQSSGQPAPLNSGNDPLTELARLIGQTDPFAEYGRNQRTTPAQVASQEVPALDWNSRPVRSASSVQPHAAAARGVPPASELQFNTPQYEMPPRTAAQPIAGLEQTPLPLHDQFQDHHNQATYDPATYHTDYAQSVDTDHYDDTPPTGSRISVIAIAGVFALVVIGTAGALGYRALFGSSGSAPPPVIKAETAPSKIVPPSAANNASNKLINDRIGDNSQPEKLVSREEQPVDLKDKIQSVLAVSSPAAAPPAVNSASTEPKKIKTIAIRPDQVGTTTTEPSHTPVRAPPPPVRTANAPIPLNASDNEAPPVRNATVRSAPARSASSGPLSLNPDAATPAARATPSVAAPRAVAPAASGAGLGAYAVQLSSQRSEADAQAAFQAMQGRYPAQLGGRRAIIRRADLGSKGVYYRALVGPFANSGEATELCNNLKAAGGQCIIQRN